jgi:protein tyrosine phosphatase
MKLKIYKILTLAGLKEGDSDKCAKYWPEEGESQTYGRIVVRHIKSVKVGCFLVRRMSIRNAIEPELEREIDQVSIYNVLFLDHL